MTNAVQSNASQMSAVRSETLIAICVATYQRPKGIARLLNSLAALEIGDFRLHLIVADNDAEGTGKPAFDSATAAFPFPTTYVVEPARGISSVRNRLVAEAFALDAAYIAFVDDDETVDTSWIQQLLQTMIEENADVVTGPQVNVVDSDVPAHLKHCFVHMDYPTGKQMNRASTGNVLYSTSLLRQIPGPFDRDLNLSGGADSLLAEAIVRHGGRIVWCAEAITYEHVPDTRLNIRWILRRQFRVGASQSQITRVFNPSVPGLSKNVAHGIAVVGVGGIRLLRALIFDRDKWLRSAAMMSYGVGEIAGVFSERATLSQYQQIEGN